MQACDLIPETPALLPPDPASPYKAHGITSVCCDTGLSSLDRRWDEGLSTPVGPRIQYPLDKYWVNKGISQWPLVLLLPTPTSVALSLLYNLGVTQS